MASMLILDAGSRGVCTALDRAVSAFVADAEARGDTCKRLRLAELELHLCVGGAREGAAVSRAGGIGGDPCRR